MVIGVPYVSEASSFVSLILFYKFLPKFYIKTLLFTVFEKKKFTKKFSVVKQKFLIDVSWC